MTPSNQAVSEYANELIDSIQCMAGMTSEAQSLEELKACKNGILCMFESLFKALSTEQKKPQ